MMFLGSSKSTLEHVVT